MSMIESIKDTFADMSYALEEVAEKTLGAVKACGKFVWEVFDEITGGNPVLAVIAIAAITVIGFFIPDCPLAIFREFGASYAPR